MSSTEAAPRLSVEASESCAALPPVCAICGDELEYFGTADYYLPGIPNVRTTLRRCRSCKAIRRDIPAEALASHFTVASYTRLEKEAYFREYRRRYFEFLFAAAGKAAGSAPRRCLDFGSAYGHFLEICRAHGCEAVGVELVERMRTLCAQRGLTAYPDVDALRGQKPFDLITVIDSIYCLADPKPLLAALRELLDDSGLLVIRVTNRNWLLGCMKFLLRRDHFGQWFGDVTIGYTKKSLAKLLDGSGFSVVRWRRREPGKRDILTTRAFYWLSTFLSCVTLGLVNISPGIIAMARKRRETVVMDVRRSEEPLKKAA
jgi:2-polyprenyl-3-methyl-5-hydroxy-6-metoxy-1,4-benzoquinol methylase